jgi:polar amino acid transport system substrate-binding protein
MTAFRISTGAAGRLLAGLMMVVVASAAPLSTANADGVMDRILREKKVRVGWSPYEPLLMRDSKSGELRGYFFDLARYIFKEIDVEPEFREVTFANLVASIQSGEIDLSIADTFITVKRAAVVDYTRPILFLGSRFLSRADETRFKTVSDLNKPDVKIAALLGGSAQDFIRRNLPQAQMIALSTTNKTAPFLEVESGRADVALNDSWAVERFVAAQPTTKPLFDRPLAVRPTAWIVKRGNYDLLHFLNASLDTAILSGLLQEMASKYPPSGQFQYEVKIVPFP